MEWLLRQIVLIIDAMRVAPTLKKIKNKTKLCVHSYYMLRVRLMANVNVVTI